MWNGAQSSYHPFATTATPTQSSVPPPPASGYSTMHEMGYDGSLISSLPPIGSFRGTGQPISPAVVSPSSASPTSYHGHHATSQSTGDGPPGNISVAPHQPSQAHGDALATLGTLGIMDERLTDAINILQKHAEGPPNYHSSLTQLESHVVSFYVLFSGGRERCFKALTLRSQVRRPQKRVAPAAARRPLQLRSAPIPHRPSKR